MRDLNFSISEIVEEVSSRSHSWLYMQNLLLIFSNSERKISYKVLQQWKCSVEFPFAFVHEPFNIADILFFNIQHSRHGEVILLPFSSLLHYSFILFRLHETSLICIFAYMFVHNCKI